MKKNVVYTAKQTPAKNTRLILSELKFIAKRLLPLAYQEQVRSLMSASYREYLLNKKQQEQETQRLMSLPRYTETTTPALGKAIKIADSLSYFFTYKEIFQKEVYKFNSDTETPYILDCGANIGLSVIYFKQLYPKARIVAFEPDERVFRLLEYNVQQFGLSDLKLLQRGVWNDTTILRFLSEGADAGRVATSLDKENITQIKTVRLRDFITEKIDFLKIDIEGAELTVLEDCKDQLGYVQRLFIEYHSFVHSPQNLSQLIKILEESNLRYYISSPDHSLYTHQPLVDRRFLLGMDLQLNIYAFRDK